MNKVIFWSCCFAAVLCYLCGGYQVLHNNAGGGFVFGLFSGLFTGILIGMKPKEKRNGYARYMED
jgi:hypothetical protein